MVSVKKALSEVPRLLLVAARRGRSTGGSVIDKVARVQVLVKAKDVAPAWRPALCIWGVILEKLKDYNQEKKRRAWQRH